MPSSPHDKLFKQTFLNPENAAVELRAVLPSALLEKVDLRSLKAAPDLTIGKDLSVRHCDVLYTATICGAPGYIYLLLEHQSSVDPLMPFRILEYVTRVLSRHIAEASAGPLLPLPVVLPVVVHHSESGWTQATEVASLFDPAMTAEPEVARYIPRLSFVLDDLSNASDESLMARAVAESEKIVPLVLWAFRDSRTADRLMASLAVWSSVLGEIWRSESGKDALIVVIGYLAQAKAELSRTQIEAIAEQAAPEAKEVLMTLAEQWKLEGRQEGRQEGQRQLLVKLLTLRFGELTEKVASKVESASESELGIWAERVLRASSLEDVLR